MRTVRANGLLHRAAMILPLSLVACCFGPLSPSEATHFQAVHIKHYVNRPAIPPNLAVVISKTRKAQLGLGPSGAGRNDQLGASVAVSSDGNTALLGAVGRAVNGRRFAGAGEVFVRTGPTWRYQVQLDLGAAAATNDDLGYAVALSKDGSTALLGAVGRMVNGQRAGAGEIFTRRGTVWKYRAQLDLGTGASSNDALGDSVALSGDAKTALLGAYNMAVRGQNYAGAGEVFNRAGTTWKFRAQLDLGAGALAGDALGVAVALNRTGSTALLGAARTVNGHTQAGAGEVFTYKGAAWKYQAQLDLGTGATSNDALGVSVALSGDAKTALLGAPGRTPHDSGPTNPAGTGVVFTRRGALWAYQAQLDLGAGALADDAIGLNVALSSDGTTALLGARARQVKGKVRAGAGEIFTRSGSTWTHKTQLDLGISAASDDLLGGSVSLNQTGAVILLGAPGKMVGDKCRAGVGEVWDSEASRFEVTARAMVEHATSNVAPLNGVGRARGCPLGN